MGTEAQDYAASAEFARKGQEMALRMIRIEVRDHSDDENLTFWVEGHAFWKASEERWNKRLESLGEQS